MHECLESFDLDAALGAAERSPTTQPGDLWLLGDHRVLCGDATSEQDVARLMDGKLAALLATDPPYLVDYTGGEDLRHDLAIPSPPSDVCPASAGGEYFRRGDPWRSRTATSPRGPGPGRSTRGALHTAAATCAQAAAEGKAGSKGAGQRGGDEHAEGIGCQGCEQTFATTAEASEHFNTAHAQPSEAMETTE